MGDERTGVIHNSSSGGVAGTHPSAIAHEVFVGSATPDQRNLIKAAIIPVACWRVDDVRFEFGSSFVRPEVAEEIELLIKLRDKYKLEIAPQTAGEPPATIFPPLSIFGHADPVGNNRL